MSPHGALSLTGPVIWFFLLLNVIAVVGALYQLVDLARRPRERYGKLGRWPWMPLPVLFLVGLLLTVSAGYARLPVPLAVGTGVMVLMFANIVQLGAYLLRVVYPKQPRGEDAEVAPAGPAVSEADEQAPSPPPPPASGDLP